MTENNECEVCIQKYTPKLRAKITCPNKECQYSVCKQCIKEYIKSIPSKKPHCMSCKKEWDESFVIENLNKTFLRGDLKSQENMLIIEQEHAKMPETMNAVEIYLQNIDTEKKIKFLNDDYKNQVFELNLKYKKINSYKIDNNLVEYLKKIDKDNELTDFLINPIYQRHSRVKNIKINYFLNIIRLLDIKSKNVLNLYIKIKEISEIDLIKMLGHHESYYTIDNSPEGVNSIKLLLRPHSRKYCEGIKIFMILTTKHHFSYVRTPSMITILKELLGDNLLIFTNFEKMIHTNSTTISSNPDMKLKGKELNEAFQKEYKLITDSFYLNMQILQNKPFEKKERKQFIMKCPGDDCRGFLSTQYKCDICKINVCPKCRAIKTEGHECKKEDIESTELIKKETKGCPQCGIPIFKISGCDQMWCIECKVAFSWRTGKIETGNIHNPHYYQWRRNQGNAVRNPGDLVCGGLIDFYILNNHLKKFVTWRQCNNCLEKRQRNMFCINCNLNPDTSHYSDIKHFDENDIFKIFCEENRIKCLLYKIHRGLGDLNPILNRYRQIVQENNNNQQLRVFFLTKDLTKKEFDKKVLNKYNTRKKVLSYLHVLELYNTVGIEQFTNLVNTSINDIKIATLIELLNTFNQLRIYTNELLIKNSKGFAGRRVNINEEFLFEQVN